LFIRAEEKCRIDIQSSAASESIAAVVLQILRRQADFLSDYDHLEKLAHLRRGQQHSYRSCLRQVTGSILGRRSQKQVANSGSEQERGLVHVTQQFQPLVYSRARDRAEIDMRSNVLQAGKEKRICVRMMPIVAH